MAAPRPPSKGCGVRICSIPDCGGKHYSLGLCRPHYRRLTKYGDPLHVPIPGAAQRGRHKDSPEHFWSRLDRSGGPDACWPWTGALKPAGYGELTWRGRKGYVAHRVALELTGIEIPAGWHVDHLCSNKRCANPAHLEPVPPRVNSLRFWATWTPKPLCRNGHPRSEFGYVEGRHLRCRKCRAETLRRYAHKQQQRRVA